LGGFGHGSTCVIKVFTTIAFSDDVEKTLPPAIANPGGGRQYDSSPETRQKIRDEIATFS